MKAISLKTHRITPKDRDLLPILDCALPRKLKEGSIVVITSKIVALTEGRVADPKKVSKHELAKKEAEWYYPLEKSKYRVVLTIKDKRIMFTSGIDESNAGGMYVLLPADPQGTANKVRMYLQKRFGVRRVGVLITDTSSVPLLRGQKGIMLAHSGFAALNSYIGKKDVFKRKLKMTKAAVADALATTAVLLMGEGGEQTPLAIIEDVPFVKFQDRNPTKKELEELHIAMEDDLYGPLLTAVKWRKGGSVGKIRSTKSEIRNKHEWQKFK